MASLRATRLLTWCNPNEVTSDGIDVSTRLHESYMEDPLLGPHDNRSTNRKAWGAFFALLTISCVALALATVFSTSEQFDWGGQIQSNESDIVESEKGVVTSDDARCSKVGVSMLKRGGHAVDAAIATALCIGVVTPTESGIGGGSFMVVRESRTSKAVAFDMREVAPAAASKNLYENNTDAKSEGPLSMAVPGELAGMHEAWKRYGRLPWGTLFEPAIKYAEDGFKIFPYLAKDLGEFEKAVMADPGLRHQFAPNGTMLKLGDTCYNKKLAESLKAVADHGPRVYYHGWVGENLVKDVRKAGGILTMDDLRRYKVNITDVLEVDIINGYKILGMPLPSSGTVGVAMITNVLSNYGSDEALEGPLGLHRVIEAMKHMFAIRMNLGDPAFDDASEYVSKMISPSFAKEIWHKINDTTTYPPDYYHSSWNQVQDGGTSHLGVVDLERNAVGLTTSVNNVFGAKMISPSTGIVINNQMDDFALPNSTLPAANLIEPGKRPLSSMSPLIILKDGRLAGVIGGSGGLNIIPAVTQTFLNHFVRGMHALHAVRKPRVFPKILDETVEYENMTVPNGEHIALSKRKMEFLKDRGHELVPVGIQAVSHLIYQTFEDQTYMGRKIGKKSVTDVDFGVLTAVADLRKDAKPAAV